jgi:plastocyanin
LSYILMKANLYHVGILVTALLVLSGPSSFATPTDTTQLAETTDQTETSQEGTVTVAIGEGSNATVQHYTFTPQSVEINAGESVTWFSPSEISEIHTVTFVQDPSIVSDIILPFAVPGDQIDFELLPPFNLGEPLLIETPDGRQAIVALNKHVWNPAVLSTNNQTTFLEGTDIQTTLNSTVKAINSGIIVPPLPPMGEDEQNRTAAGAAEIPPEAAINETTTTMSNATTDTDDISPVPDEEGTIPQPTEGATGEQQLGPPFPPVASFTVTFEDPGTYQYFCAIHPWMTGQVVVQEGTTTETQPQPEPQNQTEAQGAGEPESPNPLFG